MLVEVKISPQALRAQRSYFSFGGERPPNEKHALECQNNHLSQYHGQRKANLILFPEGSGL
jgi:hypothetical protein